MTYFHIVQRLIILLLLADLALMTVGADLLPQPAEIRTADSLLPLEVMPVRAESGGLFGQVRLRSENNFSLGYAYLLVNGERMASFADCEISLRVYPGDILSIDASAYNRSLTFYLDSYSPTINGDYLWPSVICFGDTAILGTVVFD